MYDRGGVRASTSLIPLFIHFLDAGLDFARVCGTYVYEPCQRPARQKLPYDTYLDFLLERFSLH